MLSLINVETRNLKLFEFVRKVRNSQLGSLFTQKRVCEWYVLCVENYVKYIGFRRVVTQLWSSDPRTWELAAPTIDPTSSWLLPRSTAIAWLNEEDTMSSWHLWWGLPAPTFWDHCSGPRWAK